ncbi:MAG: formate dehydrogenase subunit gamma [Pseudomonadota bacterium]
MRKARLGNAAKPDPEVVARKVKRGRIIGMTALTLSLFAMIFSASVLLTASLTSDEAVAQSSVRPPSNAVTNNAPPDVGLQGVQSGPVGGTVPGNTRGINSDADLWRFVRGQEVPDFDATVSIPDKKAATLVQSYGENWRNFRNGPLSTYGLYGLLGMLVVLVLFFTLRGRIKIEHGRAGATIERFNNVERFGHWLLATSFIILGITGLNKLYGRYFMPDVIGAEAFTSMSIAGKWLHNSVAWAFMLGLVIIFVAWVKDNIPSRIDLKWLAAGGGLFSKNVHPDSRKFNAGQKLIFWSTILLGASLSMSGIALLFPFETAMMAKTFGALNMVGFNLPTDLTPLQEMQLQTAWHGIVGLAMIIVIIAHIYIGSIGMEGAFDAMGSGEVDLNWAKEHHNLWVDEVQARERETGRSSSPAPAE